MKKQIYLDYNASTPLRQEVKDAMISTMDDFGNPSSIHSYGRRARSHIENARDILASQLEVLPSQVVFTSGGTEANNFCLNALVSRGYKVLVSAIEHESVKKVCDDALIIQVNSNGLIDLEHLEQLLAELPSKNAIVSVMLANNETGIVQPIQQISQIVKKYGMKFHCDAVTAFTKIPFNYDELGADYISLSSHKIGGPKGVGALIVRPDEQLPNFIRGGGQEKGHRAGTENILGVVGFATAIQESSLNSWQAVAQLRDCLESNLQNKYQAIPIYGRNVARLPNTSLIGMPGVAADKQIMLFDLEGFAISAGSACSSGKIEPSRVLMSSGVDPIQAQEAIRVSIGWETTQDEIDQFISTWLDIYERFNHKSAKVI